VRSVADFGAVPDDNVDDTDAIQRGINALAAGEWLVFPKGRYLHSKSLRVKQTNAVLWSEGATLHATNPGDQAVWLEADGASVYNFTLTAVTRERRTTPWESRISIFGGANPLRMLKNNVIRGNRVVNAGDPGTPLQAASGSAGIFVYHATNFLVAENLVVRSLADGIHITQGSHNGKVLKNMVRESGDDMIAVVSYVGDATTSASAVAANFAERRARQLNHHITIADNDVEGQYWGRGITVVGGEHVTIERNNIRKTTHAAAIYLAREISYLTFGVRNVLVRNNLIQDVQTTNPVFVPDTASRNVTGHGAVEIYAHLFTDEAANPTLASQLAVQNIRIENNTIERTRADGFRIGTGWGRTWSYSGRRSDGSSFTRSATGGQVGLIGVVNNKMSSIGSGAIAINNQPSVQFNVACEANTRDGRAASHGLCLGVKPSVTPVCGT
jgi:Pectate lyase superfamily protein